MLVTALCVHVLTSPSDAGSAESEPEPGVNFEFYLFDAERLLRYSKYYQVLNQTEANSKIISGDR